MKVTIDGLPLQHLTSQCHLESICNYNHPYLLINESLKERVTTNVTPIVESIFINTDILSNFALPSTRAIPIKKCYRNISNGVIVGCKESCDILIARHEISGMHAALHSIGDIWYIEDLGSLNGTWINNERIDGGDLIKLQSQQMISFGGRVGAIFIKAVDLEMLCSMLPDYWDKFNSETHTAIHKLPA